MSFSRDVRQEIAQINPVRACCCQAEMAAFLALRGSFQFSAGDLAELWLQADPLFIARKMFKNCKALNLKPVLKVKKEPSREKPIYKLMISLDAAQAKMLQGLNPVNHEGAPNERFDQIFQKTCCQRSMLRIVFMCRGFVNNPENSYHLEMMIGQGQTAEALRKILARNAVEVKISERKGKAFLYLKDSEAIGDFLRLIGAAKALLSYENTRVVKSVKNKVNRQVNCETANLSKVVDAATRQIDLLERLVEKVGWEQIALEYRELIKLRLLERESSLQELGQMMEPALSKSAVAYRMRKIEAYAKTILEQD